MPDISQITIDGTTYDVKDTVARNPQNWISDSPSTPRYYVDVGNGMVNASSSSDVQLVAVDSISLSSATGNIDLSASVGNVMCRNGAIVDHTGATITLPSGGSTGQVLSKNSASSYDVGWATPASVSFAWNQLAQKTGTASATIDLTGYSEVLVVADVLRNSAHHFFSCNFPIACISSTAAEYKLGGYVAANASTSGGAWCSLSLTSFNGVGSYINNTSFINTTTWTVYAR